MSQKLIDGECSIRLRRVAKNGIINKRGVPSIRNSIICWHHCIVLTKVYGALSANIYLFKV